MNHLSSGNFFEDKISNNTINMKSFTEQIKNPKNPFIENKLDKEY